MDEFAARLAENWIEVLQSAGIIWSIAYSAWSGRRDLVSRWVENRFLATQHHRELWRELADHSELRRIEEREVDLISEPLRYEEERFVNMVILHLNASFYAMRKGFLPAPEGLEADIVSFFSLPIPMRVWKKTRGLRDRKFADFVERVLEREHRRR